MATNSLTQAMNKVLGTTADVGQTSTYTPPDPFAAVTTPASTTPAKYPATPQGVADLWAASNAPVSGRQARLDMYAQRRGMTPSGARSAYGARFAGGRAPAPAPAPTAPVSTEPQMISRQELSDRQVKEQAAQQQAQFDQQMRNAQAVGLNTIAPRNLFPEGPALPQYGQYGTEMVPNPWYTG